MGKEKRKKVKRGKNEKNQTCDNCLAWLNRHSAVESYVEAIYVRENKVEMTRQIWKKRGKRIVLVFAVLVLAVVACITQEPEKESPLEGNSLTRAESDQDVTLTVTSQQADTPRQTEIALSLTAREFTEEEKKELDDTVGSYLQESIRGKNTSLDEVKNALNLVSFVPDTEVSLDWEVDSDYLKESGELCAENIVEPGVDTDVAVTAAWKNWSRTYHFPVHLLPREITVEELWEDQVKTVLENAVKEQSTEEQVMLPEQIGDVSVSYQTEEEKKSYMPVYFVLGFLVLLPVLWYQGQKKELEKREEQLLLDHPGIIHKFMLLLGAGMTIRKIVERLVGEYEHERSRGGQKRYVYEEMCVLLQEMRDGVSEARAMERFGKRCRILPYMRFTSVIIQNLKKGAEGMIAILEAESTEALEKRKERALQLGEKAGTKLLFPMILMLGIVMAVIMVPAFMSM